MSAEKYRRPCCEDGCGKSMYQRDRCWHHYRLLRIATEPDYLEKEAAKKLRQRRANPELDRKIRQRSLLKHYGLDIEIYESMANSLSGLCEICDRPPEPRNRKGKELEPTLCVDHCHQAGKVRGLLCNKCNSILGYCYENTNILDRAINYLVQHGKPEPSGSEPAF